MSLTLLFPADYCICVSSLCWLSVFCFIYLLCMCLVVGLDELEQPVAIKVFDKIALQKQQNRHQLQQIEKEINALRICSHPNVVQL